MTTSNDACCSRAYSVARYARIGHVAGAGPCFPRTEVPIQTLTDRMGDDMRLRGFAPKTQQAYHGAVIRLATHCARLPDMLDTLTEDELRAFFLALVTTRKVSRSTLIVYPSGIRFLYQVTLHRTWPVCDLVRPAKRHVLPVVLSTGEVRTLLASVPRSESPHGAHRDLLVRAPAVRRLPPPDP